MGHQAGLAFGQGAEHRVQLLLQQREADRLTGLDRLRILDQVTELAVAVLAQRDMQRDRLTAVLLHLDEPFRGHVQLDGQPKTLDEIGKVYGVTRERIRQIESKTMSKLRHPSRSQVLRDYLD